MLARWEIWRHQEWENIMVWAILLSAATAAVGMKLYFSGPRVPAERIAQPDLELVRDDDCAAWRKVGRRTYSGWKKQDDFYRVAAYKKAIETGMSPSDAKAYVRKEFPFYYIDPASREEDTYVGDDAGLPIVLRERVNKGAFLLKSVMAEKSGEFRTMNALVRVFIRKGAM